MRLTDREAGPAVRARLEPLGRTGLNIIYEEKSEPTIVIKAAGFWLDGEMYDHAMFAEEDGILFKREAAIYEALGPHTHILKCLGVAYLPAAEEIKAEEIKAEERKAFALKVERAPHGDLREIIIRDGFPSMTRRLQLALDLAETLQHFHDRGVIWDDLSPRNIHVFDDLNIKLSDFAGSSLRGVYPELYCGCEERYQPPYTNPPNPATKDDFAQDLFTLGTGICEITEWAIPYGKIENEVKKKLMWGEYPSVSKKNPANFVIRKL